MGAKRIVFVSLVRPGAGEHRGGEEPGGRPRPAFPPADRGDAEELDLRVTTLLRRYSPSVENPATGEYFIDLTGTRRLFGREVDTCGRILGELKELGLEARCGIGSSVLIARLAAEVASPGGVYEVFEHAERFFLPPLRIELVPGLPAERRKELVRDYSIRTVGDLLPFSRVDLRQLFGPHGDLLYDCSHAVSRSTLVEKRFEPTVRGEREIGSDRNDDGQVRRRFFDLVVDLCVQMRGRGVTPGRARIDVLYRDGYRYSTAGVLRGAPCREDELYRRLVFHLDRALRRRTLVEKVSLSFSRLSPPAAQLDLFEEASRRNGLAGAFDAIRGRYGKNAIGYGAPPGVHRGMTGAPLRAGVEANRGHTGRPRGVPREYSSQREGRP